MIANATLDDTIVAISTPIGISAISIIRLSGTNALNIARQITKLDSIRPRYAYLRYLYDENEALIDRGIVIYFKAPNSFNGEDIIEFQCHGGIMLSKKILQTCIHLGARLAREGEFSKIALLNGKMDLSMIEHISKLISANDEASLKLIARNLKGDLEKIIESFRDDLLEVLAHSEALIDYAEEEIEDTLRAKLDDIKLRLDSIYQHSLSLQHTIDGHKLALIGKPNVGKSSILNKLLLEDRAIVSDIAGTTRDIIQESLTINNQVIKIIDTAGIRESSEHIERLGIQKSLEIIEQSSIILAIFDNSREFDDDEILEIIEQSRDKIILVVINKIDMPSKLSREIFSNFMCVEVSTLDDSVYKIRDIIAEQITLAPMNADFVLLSNKRQLDCVKACIDGIARAGDSLSDYEIFSFHIKEALKSLELVSKPFIDDEVLDKMFSTFCLGK